MTPEWVAAVASVATFVVITATAIVTLIQVRHMRNGNQITVFTEIQHRMDTPAFQDAIRFVRYEVPQRVNDPAFRLRLLDRNASEGSVVVDVGNFLDSAIAPLVKHGMVDRDLACDLFYYPVVMCWDTLAPFIASQRAMLGYRMWEDFEYLALLCKDFRVRFPHGTYPRGARALPLPEPWPEIAQSAILSPASDTDKPG
jgi:Domain of unknown function (DUF4760)